MYRIGILEDDLSIIPQIKLVIEEVLKKDSKTIQYVEYAITDGKSEQNDILDEILSDISESKINTLFVDYKLDTKNIAIKGSEIIKTIREQLSEFPMVILTNVVEDGKESQATDADKVYHKEVFLNPDDARSEEMVKNILYNMERYYALRSTLEYKRDRVLQNMNAINESEVETKMDLVAQLIKIEAELQKFTPTHLLPIEKIFPIDEYKEVLNLLKEYKELLKIDGEDRI